MTLGKKILEIAHLDRDAKQTILRVIDSLLRDAKAKKRPMGSKIIICERK